MKERMKKVNGKPYLSTRFVIWATRQRALSFGKISILEISWCWHDAGIKKIEEKMKKVNGKPYLRTRFVISNARFLLGKWHVCQKYYPCVGKTDDLGQGRHEQKSDFSNICHFSNGTIIHFEMSAATKKNEFWRRCFRNCTSYAGEGHFFADDTKREKRRKREKKTKSVKKA